MLFKNAFPLAILVNYIESFGFLCKPNTLKKGKFIFNKCGIVVTTEIILSNKNVSKFASGH